MHHIRLDLSYDGRSYFGFQSQPHGHTIQDALERALQRVLPLPVRLTSASRTDTGVSSEHQVVTFRWDEESLDRDGFLTKINSVLPPEIRVHRVETSEKGFHPSYSSTGKIYRYRIWKGECLDPFCLPWVWHQRRIIDTKKFYESLSHFVGLHDFSAFSNMGSSEKSTLRKIYGIQIEEQGPLLNIWVSGNGFLKQMIRIMIGSAVDEALGRLKKPIPYLLREPSRILAGRTAPSAPLSLIKILYEPMPNLSNFIEDYNSKAYFNWTQAPGYDHALPLASSHPGFD